MAASYTLSCCAASTYLLNPPEDISQVKEEDKTRSDPDLEIAEAGDVA